MFKKILGWIILVALFAGSICALVFGIKYYNEKDINTQQVEENSNLLTTIEKLQYQANDLKKQIKNLKTEKENLMLQVDSLQEENSIYKSEIETLENNIADLNNQITELNKEVRRLEELLEEYEATDKIIVNFYSDNILYDIQFVEENGFVDESKLVNPTLKGYTFNWWTLDGETKVDLSTLVITEETNIYAKFTAQEQTIKLGFITTDNALQYEKAGSFWKTSSDSGLGYITNSGSYSAVLNRISSEEETIITIKLNSAFKFYGETISYRTNREDTSTNQYSFSEIKECDFETTGTSYETQLTISNVNSSEEILIFVEPLYYNIEICNSYTNEVVATIENIVYGREFDLNTLLTEEEKQSLSTYKTSTEATFAGIWTNSGRTGTQYCDSDFNMLKNFAEEGYTFNGTKYVVDSNYDPETRTFRFYAGYSI